MLAPNGQSQNNFGWSVAISGNIIGVGANKKDVNGTTNAGSVYLYRRSGAYVSMITAPDPETNAEFGRRMVMSEDLIVVGSSEAAYIFEIDGTFKSKLTASDGEVGDKFGSSVGISGDIVVVGAYGDDDSSGSVYIFHTNGTLIEKIYAPGVSTDRKFGWSIAISDAHIVIGARSDSVESGSVYIYTINGDFSSKIVAPDASTGDRFGADVDISNNTIIVGSYWDDDAGSKSGSAYLFSTNNTFIRKITDPNASQGNRFGNSVAISENAIIIGSMTDDYNNFDAAGSVFIYDVNGLFVSQIGAPDADEEDYFGWSVAIAGDTVLVGSSYDDDVGEDSGSVYVCVSFSC